jgi:hypothetical protein
MAAQASKEEAKHAPLPKLSLRQLPSREALATFGAITELDLTRANLQTLPGYLFDPAISPFALSLTRLDVSFNKLSALPEELANCATLKVLFAMANEFEEIPEVLGKLPNLGMLSFKSNKVSKWSETCLPPSVYWLILTDNKIKALPKSIGKLTKLQKFMMSTNRLTELPDELELCGGSLELIRLADNFFDHVPPVLSRLPKLAWVALGGNLMPPHPKVEDPDIVAHLSASLPAEMHASAEEIELAHLLGEGTSGKIHYGTYRGESAAVKVFKNSATTSDGRPMDEATVWCHLGSHPAGDSAHTIRTLGVYVDNVDGAEQLGVIMENLPEVAALGLPPSFASISRDVYELKSVFPNMDGTPKEDLETVLHLVSGFVRSVEAFHGVGVVHGDLYAHNLLVNAVAGVDRLVKMGDLGAAFFLPTDKAESESLQRIEMRAFGIFVSEMLELLEARWAGKSVDGELEKARKELVVLSERCSGDSEKRSLASETVLVVDSIMSG